MTTQTSKETRVYNLYVELEEAKARKKASAKAFNEDIKRIQAEIKDVINEEDTQNGNE
jgi:hypothetical protein